MVSAPKEATVEADEIWMDFKRFNTAPTLIELGCTLAGKLIDLTGRWRPQNSDEDAMSIFTLFRTVIARS